MGRVEPSKRRHAELITGQPTATPSPLPDPRGKRLEEHDVATSVAAALNHRSARRWLKPEQRALQVIPMRRRGIEPPPTKCGPGLNLVSRVSYPSYASIASRTSTDLDDLDDLDDTDVLDVAADVATAGLSAGRNRRQVGSTAPLDRCRSLPAGESAGLVDALPFEGDQGGAPPGSAGDLRPRFIASAVGRGAPGHRR